MKKSFIIALLFVFVLSVHSLYAGQKIRLGTEGAYPPFNYIDSSGDLQGFDIDIARALCEAAGVDYEFVVQDWDGIIPGLIAKKYDCIIASMSITDERKKRVDFTKKYYQTPVRVVASKDAQLDFFLNGIKGKKIGVQRGVVGANLARAKFGDVATIKAYATQEEANMDLVSGRVDLVCADSVIIQTGFLDTKMGAGYTFVGPNFTDEKHLGEGIGIAVRKGDTKLAELFNKAIKKIRENGVYKKINNKYFDFDVYGAE
ncbi:MAG: ABC transporter substrate-binding protein [Thermodesulfobacteriota bacterium]|nr:ABC transporter substrate-binding protein [Thermodesulfobacteriota bacterium]